MSLIEIIDAVSLVTFWVLMLIGTVSVMARVAYYRAHGFRRPRLLTRDAMFYGGLALSFGVVLLFRVATGSGLLDPALFREGGVLAVPFRLLTAGGAIGALLTFVYYEIRVIERGGGEDRGGGYPAPLPLDDDDDIDPRVPR